MRRNCIEREKKENLGQLFLKDIKFEIEHLKTEKKTYILES